MENGKLPPKRPLPEWLPAVPRSTSAMPQSSSKVSENRKRKKKHTKPLAVVSPQRRVGTVLQIERPVESMPREPQKTVSDFAAQKFMENSNIVGLIKEDILKSGQGNLESINKYAKVVLGKIHNKSLVTYVSSRSNLDFIRDLRYNSLKANLEIKLLVSNPLILNEHMLNCHLNYIKHHDVDKLFPYIDMTKNNKALVLERSIMKKFESKYPDNLLKKKHSVSTEIVLNYNKNCRQRTSSSSTTEYVEDAPIQEVHPITSISVTPAEIQIRESNSSTQLSTTPTNAMMNDFISFEDFVKSTNVFDVCKESFQWYDDIAIDSRMKKLHYAYTQVPGSRNRGLVSKIVFKENALISKEPPKNNDSNNLGSTVEYVQDAPIHEVHPIPPNSVIPPEIHFRDSPHHSSSALISKEPPRNKDSKNLSSLVIIEETPGKPSQPKSNDIAGDSKSNLNKVFEIFRDHTNVEALIQSKYKENYTKSDILEQKVKGFFYRYILNQKTYPRCLEFRNGWSAGTFSVLQDHLFGKNKNSNKFHEPRQNILINEDNHEENVIVLSSDEETPQNSNYKIPNNQKLSDSYNDQGVEQSQMDSIEYRLFQLHEGISQNTSAERTKKHAAGPKSSKSWLKFDDAIVRGNSYKESDGVLSTLPSHDKFNDNMLATSTQIQNISTYLEPNQNSIMVSSPVHEEKSPVSKLIKVDKISPQTYNDNEETSKMSTTDFSNYISEIKRMSCSEVMGNSSDVQEVNCNLEPILISDSDSDKELNVPDRVGVDSLLANFEKNNMIKRRNENDSPSDDGNINTETDPTTFQLLNSQFSIFLSSQLLDENLKKKYELDKNKKSNVVRIAKRTKKADDNVYDKISKFKLRQKAIVNKTTNNEYLNYLRIRKFEYIHKKYGNFIFNLTAFYNCSGLFQIYFNDERIRELLNLNSCQWLALRNILSKVKKFEYKSHDKNAIRSTLLHRLLFYFFRTTPKVANINIMLDKYSDNVVFCTRKCSPSDNISSDIVKAINPAIRLRMLKESRMLKK